MSHLNRKTLLYIGIGGLILGIAGNYAKKADLPFGIFSWFIGISGLAIFWLYSLLDVVRSNFWTKDTKWKYLLMVIILPMVGPFIYYYFRNEVVAPDDTTTLN